MLLPCPFCGATDIGAEVDRHPEGWAALFTCKSCGAMGPDYGFFCDDPDTALTMWQDEWNKRPAGQVVHVP